MSFRQLQYSVLERYHRGGDVIYKNRDVIDICSFSKLKAHHSNAELPLLLLYGDQKRIKKNKPATDRGPFLCLLHAHAHWSNLLLPRQQLTSPLLEQQLHLNSSFFIPKEIICLSHRIISKIQEFKTFKNKVTKMLNLTKTSFAHYDIVNQQKNPAFLAINGKEVQEDDIQLSLLLYT